MMTEDMRQIRMAIRGLTRSPGYTATALVSVGAAIGMCCSVYAVVVAVYFTPLPVKAPDRMVELWQTPRPESTKAQDYIQPVRMREWTRKEDFRTLDRVAATGMGPTLVLRTSEGATTALTAPVLGDWFGLMGVDAAHGRVLTPQDLRPDAPRAAVVSDAFWRAHLGRGQLGDIVLSGIDYRVVGIMPRSFAADRKVWLPAQSLPDELHPAAYAGVGRLKKGASAQDAAAEIGHLAAVQVAADSGLYAGSGATALPLGELSRTNDRPALWTVAGVVLAVLLVALNNLTVLTLVRAQGRSATLAVRSSLGASRWELARGLAAEGAIIGLGGSLLGIAVARWGQGVAYAFVGGGAPRPTLTLHVVALAVILGILTSIMIGLEPLRRIGSLDLRAVLQRKSAGTYSTPRERRTQRFLVGAQISLCVALLAIAAVLSTAYRALRTVDVGLEVEEVVEIVPDWDVAELESAQQWSIAEHLIQRLERVSEILGATAWRELGLEYPPRPEFEVVTDGSAVTLDPSDRLHRYYEVLPDFFETLGAQLVRGRGFTSRERGETDLVAVVTEHAAEAWWPGVDPVGRQVKLGQAGQWMTVVGVVKDFQPLREFGRTVAIRGGRGMSLLFVPRGQFGSPPTGWREFECCAGVRIGTRTSAPSKTVGSARSLITDEMPDLPLIRVASIFDTQLDGYVGTSIFRLAGLVGSGVLVALLLSMVGIAGVVGEAVNRRRHEIGIRVALGARVAQVTWVIVRESLATAAGGVAVALFLLLGLRGWVSDIAFNVYVQELAPDLLSANVLAAAAGLAIATALLTASFAVRRALRISPVEALHSG